MNLTCPQTPRPCCFLLGSPIMVPFARHLPTLQSPLCAGHRGLMLRQCQWVTIIPWNFASQNGTHEDLENASPHYPPFLHCLSFTALALDVFWSMTSGIEHCTAQAVARGILCPPYMVGGKSDWSPNGSKRSQHRGLRDNTEIIQRLR